ncbi:MAG TPA: hypothetical protein VEF04_19395 [Blastocatellia bacterium]|nr:hypothetical protein [Blastocatellia bacterium]
MNKPVKRATAQVLSPVSQALANFLVSAPVAHATGFMLSPALAGLNPYLSIDTL